MPHELASTYTSFIFNEIRRVLEHDDLGNFDLRNIRDNGIIDETCRRIENGQLGAPLEGQAMEVAPDPVAYYVEIRQNRGTFDMVYKGTAVYDANRRVTSIAGRRQKILHDPALARTLDALLEQDQGTWVATQP
jgi:hypothetical protein